MSAVIQKEIVHKLIDQISSAVTWDVLMQQIYVREVIDWGLVDGHSGRGHCVWEVREKYGLDD